MPWISIRVCGRGVPLDFPNELLEIPQGRLHRGDVLAHLPRCENNAVKRAARLVHDVEGDSLLTDFCGLFFLPPDSPIDDRVGHKVRNRTRILVGLGVEGFRLDIFRQFLMHIFWRRRGREIQCVFSQVFSYPVDANGARRIQSGSRSYRGASSRSS